MEKKNTYWWRTIASFVLVLFTMPLGHALMILMEKFMDPVAVHYAGFTMGFVGLMMVIVGVFVKGDTRQTLWGLIGGLLFWTGWVEFLFLYSTRNGCDFITWIQEKLFGKHKNKIVVQPMTHHTSIITFMELNMILWAFYLLLMFCYDKNFLGDHHPVTYLIGIGCFIGSLFMFRRQLHIAAWGANIRMAVATVIVFWTPVEILGRINFFKEFWVHPQEYGFLLLCILGAFILLLVYMWLKGAKKKRIAKQ